MTVLQSPVKLIMFRHNPAARQMADPTFKGRNHCYLRLNLAMMLNCTWFQDNCLPGNIQQDLHIPPSILLSGFWPLSISRGTTESVIMPQNSQLFDRWDRKIERRRGEGPARWRGRSPGRVPVALYNFVRQSLRWRGITWLGSYGPVLLHR